MANNDQTYYLITIWGDVEPELHGPFATEEARDQAALNHRKKQLDDGEDFPDGIYPLDVIGGKPEISTYSGGFFNAEGS
jgi:hypothetical protein